MSSPLGKNTVRSAEQAFRDAFIRLKENRPERLPLGTPVSQNAIAREAGRDPSALKKSRYPTLIAEIQNWARDGYQTSTEQGSRLSHSRSKKTRPQTEEIKDLKQQRDKLASKLVEASATIVELAAENQRLQSLTASLQESLQASQLRSNEPRKRNSVASSNNQASVSRTSPQASKRLPSTAP